MFASFLGALILSFSGYTMTFLASLLYLFFLFVGFGIYFSNNKVVLIPPGFFPLLAFTAILNLFPLFINETVNPLRYALNFNLGVLGYLFFYNHNQSFHLLTKSIKYLSFLYAGLYLLSFVFPIELFKFAGFIFPQTDPTVHFNLGLIWGFYLLTEIAQKGMKVKPHLIIITLIFAIVSFNRSVILGIILGLLYLANGEVNKIFTKWKVGFTLLGIIIFLFMGLSKTTVFNRPYFLQSIKVFFDNIWGVGMGNFGMVYDSILKGSSGSVQLSSYTHNLFTEVLVGVGLFSIPFFVFVFRSASFVVSNKNIKGLKAALILLTVSFMLDYTYAAGGFIWLFFGLLGDQGDRSLSRPN